jgi:hypothetical protein
MFTFLKKHTDAKASKAKHPAGHTKAKHPAGHKKAKDDAHDKP